MKVRLKWALVFSAIGIFFVAYALSGMQFFHLHLFGIEYESDFFFGLAGFPFSWYFMWGLYNGGSTQTLNSAVVFVLFLYAAVLWFAIGSLIGIIYQNFISPLNNKVKITINILIPVILLILLACVYLTAEPRYNHFSMQDCTNKLYQLKFNFNVEQCYLATEYTAENLSDCENLPIAPADGAPVTVKVGSQTTNYYGADRYYCYGVIAQRKNDFSICDKIPGDTFPTALTTCVFNVACLNHNCQALQEPWRSQCESSGSCGAK